MVRHPWGGKNAFAFDGRHRVTDDLSKPAFAPGIVARNTAAGFWLGRTVHDMLAEAAARHPDRTLIVDVAGRVTYGEALEQAARLAGNLAAMGVGPGDVVAVQLPNWRHFPLLEYALARLGAVCTPLPHIYRHRELRLMLGLVEPKVAIVPGVFRGFDHAAMLREVAAGVPGLRHLVVAGEAPAGMIAFDDLLGPATPPPALSRPDHVSEIVFTSGTTGEPKGVMHTANTNLCPLVGLVADQRLGPDDVVLMASTFGHQTGFVYGGQLPVMIGGAVVLMERWDAAEALRLIARERVTFTMGATPFLQDLAGAEDAAAAGGSLRTFLCSGAPIPRSLLNEARRRLGCAVATGWGMTELGLMTVTRRDDPPDAAAESDGRVLPGNEVRLVDERGADVAPGEEGEVVGRGPTMFAGYYRRPEITASLFDAEGWFRTGDRARAVDGGNIRISGRTKDIVIRGGENIPVIEVEDLLHRHPALAGVAVVAVPDPRFQEKACAAVMLRPGATFDFAAMREHLESLQLARQFFPEYLVVLEDFPMTPSGKVQKYLLRERVVEALRRRGELPRQHREAANAG